MRARAHTSVSEEKFPQPRSNGIIHIEGQRLDWQKKNLDFLFALAHILKLILKNLQSPGDMVLMQNSQEGSLCSLVITLAAASQLHYTWRSKLFLFFINSNHNVCAEP